MRPLFDIDDFEIGSTVMTPTGRVGTVVKHHKTSKYDNFQRVSVRFGKNPRDGVVLQPHLLTMVKPYDKKPEPDNK